MANQVSVGRWSIEGIIDALTVLLAGDPLTGAKLHLYQSTFSPTGSSVYADFLAAEADFTGYAPVTLTWTAVGLDAAGNPTALSDRAFFQATDAVSPNVIGGAFLTHDVTGPPAVHTNVQYYPFADLVSMAAALAFCGVVVATQMPGGPGYALVDN